VLLDVGACALNHLDVDIREAPRAFRSSRRSSSASRSWAGSPPSRGRRGLAGRRPRDAVPDRHLRHVPLLRERREQLCLTPGFISVATSGGYAEQLACPAAQLMSVPRI